MRVALQVKTLTDPTMMKGGSGCIKKPPSDTHGGGESELTQTPTLRVLILHGTRTADQQPPCTHDDRRTDTMMMMNDDR
jgi:hypothetical protein